MLYDFNLIGITIVKRPRTMDGALCENYTIIIIIIIIIILPVNKNGRQYVCYADRKLEEEFHRTCATRM